MSVQEDRFMHKENFQGSQINAFYAVFDGHGGYHAAEFCKNNLEKKMENLQITPMESNNLKSQI